MGTGRMGTGQVEIGANLVHPGPLLVQGRAPGRPATGVLHRESPREDPTPRPVRGSSHARSFRGSHLLPKSTAPQSTARTFVWAWSGLESPRSQGAESPGGTARCLEGRSPAARTSSRRSASRRSRTTARPIGFGSGSPYIRSRSVLSDRVSVARPSCIPAASQSGKSALGRLRLGFVA